MLSSYDKSFVQMYYHSKRTEKSRENEELKIIFGCYSWSTLESRQLTLLSSVRFARSWGNCKVCGLKWLINEFFNKLSLIAVTERSLSKTENLNKTERISLMEWENYKEMEWITIHISTLFIYTVMHNRHTFGAKFCYLKLPRFVHVASQERNTPEFAELNSAMLLDEEIVIWYGFKHLQHCCA